MNSRERFMKVINGEMPDRVPVTLFIQDQGHFINQMYPEVDPLDYYTLLLKVIEFQKQLGVDIFVRMLFDITDPLNIMLGGLNVKDQTEDWQVHTENIVNGSTTVQRSTIKTPDGILTQDFSINEERKGTLMYACTKHPIESEEDLDIAIKYEPKMTLENKAMIKKNIKRIKDVLGNDGILGTWTPGGVFNNVSTLINHEDLYCLFLTDYEYYEKLMNFGLNRITDYALAMEEGGADVLLFGGNVAGGFLGSEFYDKYIMPFEKKYVDTIQKNGTPAMLHNCGEIMNLVESYKKLGVRMVEPFSPSPLGDADLAKAKEIVNGEYIITGGIDQVNVLQKGSVDLVKEVTERTMKIGKPGGGFILQSADFLEYGTPLENLEAYVKTAMENAWY
ncbi:hypothetical protein SH2C18_44450 [Clostridium sediminicola]|uniref:uroporphyrinogen decarboxylase family protein n=1 Tax=Clostridium sediminicola TaxID=3114879 RepID=UPI0031F25A61